MKVGRENVAQISSLVHIRYHVIYLYSNILHVYGYQYSITVWWELYENLFYFSVFVWQLKWVGASHHMRAADFVYILCNCTATNQLCDPQTISLFWNFKYNYCLYLYHRCDISFMYFISCSNIIDLDEIFIYLFIYFYFLVRDLAVEKVVSCYALIIFLYVLIKI